VIHLRQMRLLGLLQAITEELLSRVAKCHMVEVEDAGLAPLAGV